MTKIILILSTFLIVVGFAQAGSIPIMKSDGTITTTLSSQTIDRIVELHKKLEGMSLTYEYYNKERLKIYSELNRLDPSNKYFRQSNKENQRKLLQKKSEKKDTLFDVVLKYKVEVQASPNWQAEAIEEKNKGDKLTVISIKGVWYEVVLDNDTSGWIAKKWTINGESPLFSDFSIDSKASISKPQLYTSHTYYQENDPNRTDFCFSLGKRYGRCAGLAMLGRTCAPKDDFVMPEMCQGRN